MRLTDETTVGERVAFYRRRRGITQEVLAAMFRYDGMARLLGVPDRPPVKPPSWRHGSPRRLCVRRPSDGHALGRCSRI